MPMKGRYPIRRTLEYLQKGDIIFKNRVKIMTVNYNTHGELSEGARSELTTASLSSFHNYTRSMPCIHCFPLIVAILRLTHLLPHV